MSFWNTLPKPIFALAPMADVTDPAYRRLIAETGAPDVMWTEFVSADGLYHTREKKGMKDSENPLVRDLQYSEGERPVVAQIFSNKPEMIAYAAELATTLGFDGVDINMGCPVGPIQKQGAGAALIQTPDIAVSLVHAAREGVARAGRADMPVSVKTRIGYTKEILDEWIPKILSSKPDALTIHLRTRKEMSNVPAHWELMARAVEIRNDVSPETVLLGNGDVKSLAEAREKVAASGCDGVMLGRAIFGNPWLFTDRVAEDISSRERLAALLTLARYFSELKPAKHFSILKKHFKVFVSGFDGAAELRARLMETNSLEELAPIVEGALQLV